MNRVRSTARRSAGFTLIEALVVLAILGLVTAIVVGQINSYWQRSRLQTAAGDIRSFLQTVYQQSVTQHTPITVTLQQDSTTGLWTLEYTPHYSQGAVVAPFTYVLPDYISLAYNPTATTGGWPAIGSVRTLVCDTLSRTLCPVGATCGTNEVAGAQVLEVKTLSISHVSMVAGSLTPNTRFDIQIFPVWGVTYKKVLL